MDRRRHRYARGAWPGMLTGESMRAAVVQLNSGPDPAANLAGTVINRQPNLTWSAPGFGQIRRYYVWRADITKVPMSKTNPPTLVTGGTLIGANAPPMPKFTDTTVKNNALYEYFVTSALGAPPAPHSGASNKIKCDTGSAGTCAPVVP